MSAHGEVPAQPGVEAGAASILGARKAPPPVAASPQLATLVDTVPSGPDWVHEPKLDGYRLLCHLDHSRATLRTRGGHDWSSRFPALAAALAGLPCQSAILDGEAVLFDAKGRSSFQGLQNAIARRDARIALVVFDLLYLDGYDLRDATLRARKQALRALLGAGSFTIRYSEHIEGRGPDFFREACRAGLEGIVSKRADAPYRGARTRSWLKIKCHKKEDMVIVGFTEPGGSRVGFGALLLATRDAPGQPLRYAGKVGTGFSSASLHALRRRLAGRIRRRPPLADPPRGLGQAAVRWVEPELVAEVMFAEWTDKGLVRHASFRGLREDKPASAVLREASDPKTRPPRRQSANAPVLIAGVRLSNPGKLLFPVAEVSKLELALYYQSVADPMLANIRDRPLTLVRCPDGHHEHCFYQKHVPKGAPAVIGRIAVEGEESPYFLAKDVASLVALVQLGVVEIHVWGSRAGSLEQPDMIVFDLDPAAELPWSRVVSAAHRLRARLEGLGLSAFVRLTGGKGLHVIAPIVIGPGWTQVKGFARHLAESLATEEPALFTSKMAKSKRGGKIFIDYLRNARKATAIASYSPRARDGAPVALPVEWEELQGSASRPPRVSLRDVLPRIHKRKRDPWRDFETARRPLPL